MIHCTLRSDAPWTFESIGHGSVDNRNAQVSISCAAVSAFVRSIGSLLAAREGVALRINCFQPGMVKLAVTHVDKNDLDWFRGVNDMLIQGLEDIQRDFPDQMKFTKIPK